MKRLLAALCLFVPLSAYAADARLSYKNLDGSTSYAGLATPVCGIGSSGDPISCVQGAKSPMEYKSLSGQEKHLGMVVPVCSVDANGVPQICDLSGGAVPDLSGYLTTADAASIYAPIASPAFTGTPTAPTPATKDNSTSVATTAFVNNAFQSVEYSVQGDISTAGSYIEIPFGTSGLYAKFAYTGSGSASMSFYTKSGTLSPVDIRRNSIWGGSGVETYTLDNSSVGTDGVTADGTIYTASQDSSAYFIRVGGQVYFLTVWASNNGSRAFMGVHKMI